MNAGSCGHVNKGAPGSLRLRTDRGKMSVCGTCWKAVCREFGRIPDNLVCVSELKARVAYRCALQAWVKQHGGIPEAVSSIPEAFDIVDCLDDLGIRYDKPLVFRFAA
jgi:hypothetical protein